MIRSLQGCRAAAALLVVMLHTSHGIFALPKYFHSKPLGDFFSFGGAGVDFFFVLSGFIIAHVHGGDVGKPDRLRGYLWKRCTRIYPAYWVVLLIIVPVFFVAPQFGGGHEREPGVLLCSFLLLPRPDIGPILIVAWSLCYEIFFYALFAGLIASRRWGGAVLTAWIGLVAIGLVAPFGSFPGTFLGNLYHCYFLAGMLVALALKRCTIPMPRLVAVLGAIVFLGTGMFEVHGGPLDARERMAGYLTGSVLLLAGLIEAERRGRLRTPRWLIFLGDASYSIYLVHFCALSVVAKLAKTAALDAWVPHVLLLFALAAAAVGTGCLFHIAVERPLLRLLRPRHPDVAQPTPRATAQRQAA
jgi:peptidoglycan/LPS O-acetylase OafA/YrhL